MATSGLSYDNRSSPSDFAHGNGPVIHDNSSVLWINYYLFYTSYSYNSISRYSYLGISAHTPRRDLVIFCALRSHTIELVWQLAGTCHVRNRISTCAATRCSLIRSIQLNRSTKQEDTKV